MTAYNVVRMRVKAGREKEFMDMNNKMAAETMKQMKQNGFRKLSVIKTGERAYCIVGEWDSFDAIVKSRPEMIKQLDMMRGMLEDLGGGMGVTDAVSGEAVAEF